MSEVEAGKMQLENVSCSPVYQVGAVCSVLQISADEQGIELRCRADGPIPREISTHPVRFRQTLLNLIGNAIKFTEQGSVTIVLKLVRKGRNNGLAVHVIDTGIGIKPESIERIFEPFSQADTSIIRKYGGTGLGLPICRRLAEAMGGTLTAQSVLGKGSVFTLTIGIEERYLEDVYEPSYADFFKVRVRNMRKHFVLPPARILLADDGDANRRLIKLVLGRAGAFVTTVENGQKALDLVLDEPFDLVLMDMQMPVKDGYTATRELRQNNFEKPIIALTAHAMEGDRDKCLSSGCSHFLTKPIDMEQLIQAVTGALKVDLATTQKLANVCETNDAPPMSSVQRPSSHAKTLGASDRIVRSPVRSTLPMDDPDFRDIVEEFIKHLRQKISVTCDAWKQGDYEQLLRLGHWLKGSGGTAGFAEFTELGGDLEVAAKESDDARIGERLKETVGIIARIDLTPSVDQRIAANVQPVIAGAKRTELPFDKPKVCNIVSEIVDTFHEGRPT